MLRCKIDLAYRLPLAVVDSAWQGRYAYPLCPRCSSAIDREYMAYCCCCGQCLNWNQYHPLPHSTTLRQNRGGR